MFDAEYSEALAEAVKKHASVNFWIYTRSFHGAMDFMQPLLGIPNLTVHMSLDPVNLKPGLLAYIGYGGPSDPKLRLCYMSKTNDFHGNPVVASVFEQEYGDAKQANTVRVGVCPADTGKIALEGACPSCMRCLKPGPEAVWFKS